VGVGAWGREGAAAQAWRAAVINVHSGCGFSTRKPDRIVDESNED